MEAVEAVAAVVVDVEVRKVAVEMTVMGVAGLDHSIVVILLPCPGAALAAELLL